MSAASSAGFFSSISTSGKPLTNSTMSGRRVWCGPLIVNWLTAQHSLRPGSAQSTRRTKSPTVSPSRWYCTGTPATSSLWNARLADNWAGTPKSSTAAGRLPARRLEYPGSGAGWPRAGETATPPGGSWPARAWRRRGQCPGRNAPHSPTRPAKPGFLVRVEIRSSRLALQNPA